VDRELLEQRLPTNTLGGPRKDDVSPVQPGLNRANFVVGAVVLILAIAGALLALGLVFA
jgi:hypothetical protein